MRLTVWRVFLVIYLDWCGINTVAVYQLPKLKTRVRFPYPAQGSVCPVSFAEISTEFLIARSKIDIIFKRGLLKIL